MTIVLMACKQHKNIKYRPCYFDKLIILGNKKKLIKRIHTITVRAREAGRTITLVRVDQVDAAAAVLTRRRNTLVDFSLACIAREARHTLTTDAVRLIRIAPPLVGAVGHARTTV
jgi:hypothetical protein